MAKNPEQKAAEERAKQYRRSRQQAGRVAETKGLKARRRLGRKRTYPGQNPDGRFEK